jgi:hypothetical protein
MCTRSTVMVPGRPSPPGETAPQVTGVAGPSVAEWRASTADSGAGLDQRWGGRDELGR